MHGKIQLIMPHDGEYGNGRQENHYLILYFHLEINDVYKKKKKKKKKKPGSLVAEDVSEVSEPRLETCCKC